MLRRTVCSMALVVALISLVGSASAQNFKGTPKPTIQDYGPFTDLKVQNPATVTKAASGKCGNPAQNCLFYGGDFIDNPFWPAELPNGLANETTTFVSGYPYGAATWVPFTVPAGQTWQVKGLFSNNQSEYGVLDQEPNQPKSAAFWSINQGIYPGSAGTVIASGTSAATSTPTGRFAFGLQEYTVQVTALNFVLTPGSYWMIVIPLCTNTADPYCGGVFFESDVEYINGTPTNAFGPPEPLDAGFFDSPYFGYSFGPAYGPLGACGGAGCDAFSAGVLGKQLE